MCLTLLLALFSIASAKIKGNQDVGIIGGNDAVEGQFPFAVAVAWNVSSLTQLCNGVILNTQWVLSSADCVAFANDRDNVTVHAGNISMSSSNAFLISQVITHEEYDEVSVKNNIGLIKIEGEFTFDDNTQPVEIGSVEDNQNCTILGWGASDETNPDDLKFLETITINENQCRDAVSQIWEDLYLGPETVCTLSDQNYVGSCYGDEGGALVCDNKLAGIISFIVYRCADGNPDVHVRASYYEDWIKSHIAD